MSAASSQVPAVAASHDRLNRPLVFVVNKEAASRFPEKTSQWSTSQLVSQPRPLSLACHASRGSVSRLEEMADFHWSEQPPARPDPSLYVYYTYAPAPPPSASHPPTPSYELASTSSLSDPSSNSLLVTSEEMAYAMEMLDQFNEATELLEYNGQPFLALQADDQYFTLPLSTDAYLSTPETQTVSDLSSPYAQFPPISPPASSLPIPSCLRQPEAESTGYAPGITGEEDYVPRAFRNQQDPLGPAFNWPPTSPDASSLPVPSWYASLASSLAQAPGPTPNAGGSSKDRAHRQNMMEKRRARRSSPNSTPRPLTAFARSERLSERDNVPLPTTSGDSASKSGHSSSSLSPEGAKGRGGRRRKPLPPLYTFAPRENFEASPPQPKPRKQRPSDVFRYVAAPPPYDSKQPLLTRPL